MKGDDGLTHATCIQRIHRDPVEPRGFPRVFQQSDRGGIVPYGADCFLVMRYNEEYFATLHVYSVGNVLAR